MKKYHIFDLYNLVRCEGDIVGPRGHETLEVKYFQGIIENPWSDYKARNYNLDYYKREMQWYLTGDHKDHRILKHAKMWEKLVQVDGTILSNYGYYWFGPQQGFRWAYRSILKDKDSRQAYIPMNNYHHAFIGNKDFVCTKGISFRIDKDVLDIHVAMRSSDLVFGVGTDIPCFWTLWMMMGKALNKPLGKFVFSTDSLHIYDKHYDMANKLICAGPNDRHGFMFPILDDHIDLIHLQYRSDFGQWLTQAPL